MQLMVVTWQKNKAVEVFEGGSTGALVASFFFTIRETTEYLNHLHTKVQLKEENKVYVRSTPSVKDKDEYDIVA